MEARVKKEPEETPRKKNGEEDGEVKKRAPVVIDLDDTGSSSSSDSDEVPSKRSKVGVIIPDGFLAPLSTEAPGERAGPRQLPPAAPATSSAVRVSGAKQFWKAGDYEARPSADWDSSGGIDHVRVHPKFLHSNATSHKWALGAFAELLDNSLDEVDNGASYVNIDMLQNRKDGSRMLLIEDNGGGMDPDRMRQCMSLGYSAKSKLANTIGQYGNGFKTSTMRLGADVIVFSRCLGKNGKSFTQSIGMLSYTFLRSTGKEDIVVPMLDYDRRGGGWNQLIRSSPSDWRKNVETITQWSPYSSEADLLRQFSLMKDHGTRIVIYNLWEDDQGLLELDFDADEHDIQLRGVNRDEKNIQMANQFPNSRHFLTYRHSLRSYASILYLRLPSNFRIILRGKDVEHHNIVNDMMLSQEVTYRPQHGVEGLNKDDMAAVVTIGFVKDAKHHIDVQGFNVYHKNRLIKPFWRLWNAAGSGGRGVIGVLEANFVEPAHDKQGFERTTVLARLETKLIQMQKNYWKTHCHRIGYAACRNKNFVNGSTENESSPDYDPRAPSKYSKHVASGTKPAVRISEKFSSMESRRFQVGERSTTKAPPKSVESLSSSEPSSPSAMDMTEHGTCISQPKRAINDSNGRTPISQKFHNKDGMHTPIANLDADDSEQDHASAERVCGPHTRSKVCDIEQLREENRELKERLAKRDSDVVAELERELQAERDKFRMLENQLQEAQEKIEQLNKEQETLIDIFSEERERREAEEQTLRKKLKEASMAMDDLLNKVKLLENAKSLNKSDA